MSTKTISYSTDTLAKKADMHPASLRNALSRKGHWNGIRPIKLPSKRLLWPADQVDALLTGEQPPTSALSRKK